MLYKDIKVVEDSGQVEEAKNMYREEVEKGNYNYYFSGYSRCCKNLGLDEEFIEFLNAHQELLKDEKISNQYSWIIYKTKIKNEIDIQNLQKYANIIIKSCRQGPFEDNNSTPYVLTIKRIVKVLKDQNNPNYRLIKEWILKLNQNDLRDDNIFNYKDESGTDRENPSYKEFYIQTLSKCYEKLGLFKECVTFCEESLKLNIKWHYNNKKWITARMLYCKCQIADDYGSAVEEYKRIVEINKFWYMYYKLGNLYFRKNDLQNALKYQFLALDFRQEHKKLVNVLLQLAFIFQAKGEIENAKLFAHATANLRIENSWGISDELEFIICSLSIDIKKPIDWASLKKIKNEISTNSNFTKINEGKIKKLIKNGFSGFIEQKGLPKDIFFNLSDVLFDKNKITEGMTVRYKLIEKDGSYKAINIKDGVTKWQK